MTGRGPLRAFSHASGAFLRHLNHSKCYINLTFEEKSGMEIQLFMQSATGIEAVSTMRT